MDPEVKVKREPQHPSERNGVQVLPEALPNIVAIIVAYGNPQHTHHINNIMER